MQCLEILSLQKTNKLNTDFINGRNAMHRHQLQLHYLYYISQIKNTANIMKKLFIIICLLASNYCFSQSLPDYDNVKMEQKSDYKEADNVAQVAANYLLSTPFQKTIQIG